MSGIIIRHDFGKEQTEAVRRFTRLVGLVESQHAEILADPIKYMNIAADEIYRLRMAIRDIHDSARPRPLMTEDVFRYQRSIQTITITRDEYNRWKAVEAKLRKVRP